MKTMNSTQIAELSRASGENETQIRNRLAVLEAPIDLVSPRMRKLREDREARQAKIDEIDSRLNQEADFESCYLFETFSGNNYTYTFLACREGEYSHHSWQENKTFGVLA